MARKIEMLELREIAKNSIMCKLKIILEILVSQPVLWDSTFSIYIDDYPGTLFWKTKTIYVE